MRKAAQRACRLNADLGVGVVRERGQALAQRGLTQPRGKLGEAGQGRIVGTPQALLQVFDHHRPRSPQHRGVIRLNGRGELRQPIQRRQGEGSVLHPLQRRDGRHVHGGMPIVDQARQPGHVPRHGGDTQESRGFQPLPPPRRGRVRPHQPGPPAVLERLGELAPPFTRHARRTAACA